MRIVEVQMSGPGTRRPDGGPDGRDRLPRVDARRGDDRARSHAHRPL